MVNLNLTAEQFDNHFEEYLKEQTYEVPHCTKDNKCSGCKLKEILHDNPTMCKLFIMAIVSPKQLENTAVTMLQLGYYIAKHEDFVNKLKNPEHVEQIYGGTEECLK